MNNLDNFLNAVFGKKKNSVEPDDSFVTYLGNKLRFEFEKEYKFKKETKVHFFTTPKFWIPGAALSFIALALLFVMTKKSLLNPSFKTTPNTQNEIAMEEIDQELAMIDLESKELEKILSEL